MRVASFVSGGFLPQAVRGTSSHVIFHIADWVRINRLGAQKPLTRTNTHTHTHTQYPTICGLAGVDGHDDPPVMPLAPDTSDPSRDLYINGTSFPPVDGRKPYAYMCMRACV